MNKSLLNSHALSQICALLTFPLVLATERLIGTVSERNSLNLHLDEICPTGPHGKKWAPALQDLQESARSEQQK